MKIKPLLKQEVIDAIEGVKSPSRVPSTFTIWPPPSYKDLRYLKAVSILKKYPGDIKVFYTPSYLPTLIRGNNVLLFKRTTPKGKALDESIVLQDYSELDEFIAGFNDPKKIIIPLSGKSKKYKLAIFWNFLFENLWQIRGMENTLTDFYDYPDEVHKLFRAITDFYKTLLIRSKKLAKCDGFFISDDLGHQTTTFFSPAIFKEFFFPYYKELADAAHDNGMHLWLHTCGNIENFMPMFIESGLDVIHPIQKYTMDEVKIFNKYKDKICFLYGFDVQQIIPFGTVEDVKNEIHRVFDLFANAEGRFLFTAGNGITPNCPIESFITLVSESKTYNPYKQQ